MNRFCIYSKATGQIIQTVSSPDADEFDTATTGFVQIDDSFDSASYFNGMTLVAMPEQPSPHHHFDYTTRQWVDPRTLTDLKVTKTQEINTARLRANRATFTFMGKQISCDELSRSDIDAINGSISLTSVLPANWPGGWKTADNSYVAIPDVATWISFYGAMVTQGQANFAYAQDLKAQLELAATSAEVATINW